MLVNNLLIKRVEDLRTGTSKSTGNSWASRNILLEWEDETGKAYINAVVDEEVWKSLGYQEGDFAALNLRFRTQAKTSGFILNDIRIINPQNAQAL